LADNLFVGVDIGGTKVAVGLVNAKGEILSQVRIPMVANGSSVDGLNTILSAISKTLPTDSRSLQGIGICAPGPLDPRTGVILNPPNLPCWRDFPLAAEVQKAYSVPVEVDNDANAAALAEARWGAARGYNNVFYATLGTGIGTGIVFDGEIYHGRTGAAGEGGHVSIDRNGPLCGCGKPGCIEVLASGTAIVKRVRARMSKGNKSLINELTKGDPESITGQTVAQSLAANDVLTHEILTDCTEMLALWLSNMVDILDPEIIVIGGGAAALYEPFFGNIRERVPAFAINPNAHEIPIAVARYGADSGIAGGAALCT